MDLDAFHAVSGSLTFAGVMESLLGEFRRGRIADRDRQLESAAIQSHLGQLYAAWETVFPPFPECSSSRRTSAWEGKRGQRDRYLRRLIIAWIPGNDAGRRLVVNPATVLGRHARAVARGLPDYQVIGTDVDHRGNRLYRLISPLTYPGLKNYRFARESVYEPDRRRNPAAVIFFGACGSVTDASMDYALMQEAPFLICRSCCHDNIGGNTEVVKRPGFLNWFFRFKNYGFARGQRLNKWPYCEYFSDRYGPGAYPRSELARGLMDTETILAVARNSVDSDICRSLIDLDRCQFLKENGYDVMYREELFFAHRRAA